MCDGVNVFNHLEPDVGEGAHGVRSSIGGFLDVLVVLARDRPTS